MSETINLAVETSTVFKMLYLAFAGFALSMLLTPVYTAIAYKQEWWKKPRKDSVTGETATVYQQLHAKKHRRHIPTAAGLIFVVSVAIVTLIANLSRVQTWLPLALMVGAGMVGLVDDYLNVKGHSRIAGINSKAKMLLITAVALAGGLWFHYKLDVSSISIPFIDSPLTLGWLIVPLFVLVVVSAANAVNITDGLDGLAGGLTAIAFSVYAIIALVEERYGIAGFCLTIVGALLSYTWFNVFPARFFMGDSGSFALGTALGVVAMITDTVLILPIIGFLFVAEAGSSIIQIASKKLRNGKKIFKIAPLHHHFEAMGWGETKVTMRFWIIGQVMGVVGLAIYFVGRGV